MPAFIAHHVFAEEALALLPEGAAVLCESFSDLYFWGAQGPDPLAFHDAPLLGPLVPLCDRLHTGDPLPLFEHLCRTCRGSQPKTVWALGFLTHYVLDHLVEPLLLDAAEKYQIRTGRASLEQAHLQVSAELDRAIITEFLSGSASDYPAYQLLHPLRGECRRTAPEMLAFAASIAAASPISVSAVLSAMNAMRMTTRTLHCSSEEARRTLVHLEERAGCPGRMTARLRPSLPLPGDVLNTTHSVWRDGSGTPRTEDAFSLFHQALCDLMAPAAAVFDCCTRAKPLPSHFFDETFYGSPVNRP